MKVIGILFLLFLSTLCYAQSNWIKGDAVWHYTWFNVASGGWIKLYTAGDTLIQSKSCVKLKSIKHEFITTGPEGGQAEFENPYLDGIIYYKNDTVFYWDHDHFSVLYDFNAIQGDDWMMQSGYANFDCNDTSYCHVDTVNTINLSGQTYKQLILSPFVDAPYCIQGPINARFGASSAFLLPFVRACSEIVVVEFDQIQFTCFQDDSLYYNPSESDCEFYLGLNSEEVNHLSVNPNPAVDHLEIVSEVKIVKATLFNALGTEVYTTNEFFFTHTITTTLLNSGIYFLNIETLSGEQIIKKIQIAN